MHNNKFIHHVTFIAQLTGKVRILNERNNDWLENAHNYNIQSSAFCMLQKI